MPLKLRQGGAWRDITTAKVYQGGAWRTIKSVKIYQGGEWRDVANLTAGLGTITLSLNASTVSIARRLSTITTGNVIATPSGGQTPYTYSWAQQSGGAISANNPANAITSFTAFGMVVGETRNAVFRCTCTDAFGSSATADVTVSITRLPPLGDPDNPDL